MKKIGVIYSFNTVKTGQAAKHIIELFGDIAKPVNAEEITSDRFLEFDYLILGVPTWFDGELPNYWDEFIPELEDMDLKSKTVALFGNGDQKGYPENFVDGIGIMAMLLESRGAKLVGFTSAEGYSFENSAALRGNMLAGLALDFENQAKLNKERISRWVEQLKKEFI
jgi:flavodoxin I